MEHTAVINLLYIFMFSFPLTILINIFIKEIGYNPLEIVVHFLLILVLFFVQYKNYWLQLDTKSP
jgi:hypothetical protein